MTSWTRTLRARWIFPIEGEPVHDAILTLRDGRVGSIEPAQGRPADLDLGNAAILPGFVNAHTHLELSAVAAPSEGPVEDEVAWLSRVIEQRRTAEPGALEAAVARNLQESIRAGTTMLADISSAGLSWSHVAQAPVRAVVYAELIGLKRERALETSLHAYEWLNSVKPESMVAACARPGLSPHAPYSTAGWLYNRVAGSQVPLSTHLAEMPEELQLLQTRRGRLREFLRDLGAWDDEWEPIGSRPTDYIRRGDLRRADWLIAHGNYLDPSDFWQLRPEAAPEGQRVAVAYCPRTALRFGHRQHPYRAMLERGVIVCFGTDSLASAPSLSILDEIRALHRADPSLGGPLLLTMATLFGAWSMRADTVTGSLRPGKSADLAIVALPDRADPDPHTLLLEASEPVLATMFEGKFVAGPWTEA